MLKAFITWNVVDYSGKALYSFENRYFRLKRHAMNKHPQPIAKVISRIVFAICTIAFVVIQPAKADVLPCVAGALSTLLNTTCSIGGLAYSFESASNQNQGSISNFTTSNIFLTPDASHNGFILSGTFSDTAPVGGIHTDELNLAVSFATLDGQAWVTGVISGVSGSVSGNGLTRYAEFNQVDANSNGVNGPVNSAYAQPGVPGSADNCGIGPGPSGNLPASCTTLFNLGPVSATDRLSQALYGIEALDGGTATIDSAEYFVTGTAPTNALPEPTNLGFYLLEGALFLLACKNCRRRPCKILPNTI